jgi:NitT/TauT family transport system permease protein
VALSESGKGRGIRIASLLVVILIWQGIAMFLVRNPFILPPFTGILQAFGNLLINGTILSDLSISLLHFAIGLGMALLIGIPLGILMGWYRHAESWFDPVIEIVRPIPPLAWIPFAIVWFGLTHQSAGFVIFIGAVFPILINTYSGFRSVPRIFVEAAKVLGCRKDREIILHIALPSAFPSITAGIRIATGVGWMCLVAAELFGVSKFGLGQKMWFYYYLHQMDNVVVYMLLLGFIGLFIDMIFRYYVDRKLLRWRVREVV